jgi:HEPN domain-containing protein
MNARPQAWLQQAKDDFGVARLTRDNSYYPQACYFASQAAEKALKGLIKHLVLLLQKVNLQLVIKFQNLALLSCLLKKMIENIFLRLHKN